MKKLFAVLLFFGVVLSAFAISGRSYIGVLTTNEIAKGFGAEVISNKNGVLEGILKKETLNKSLVEYAGKIISDPAVRAEVIDDIMSEEVFKNDINFKYHYEINPNSLKPEIKGEIEVTDRDSVSLFAKLFGSTRALSLEFKDGNTTLLAKDISYKDDDVRLFLKAPRFDTTSVDNSKGINGAKFGFSNVEISDLYSNDSFVLSDIYISSLLTTPFKSGDNIFKFLSKDSTHELGIGEILYKDNTQNLSFKGTKYNIKLTDSIDEKSSIFDIITLASTHGLDMDSFVYDSDDGKISLGGIKALLDRQKVDDSIVDSQKFIIDSLGFNFEGSEFNFKNLTLNSSSKISKSLYKLLIDSNFIDDIESMDESEVMDILAKNFGSGVDFKIDEISVQNHKGDKIKAFASLSVPLVSDIENGDMSMLKSLKSSLKISTTSSLAEFLSQTDEGRAMGNFADMVIVAGFDNFKGEFETFKPEILSLLNEMKFDEMSKRVQNLKVGDIFNIKDNGAYELNLDEISMALAFYNFDSEIYDESDDFNDESAEMLKSVTNLQMIIFDIYAYYTSQGEFAPKIYDMTNVALAYEESYESEMYGVLEDAGKNCFTVNIKISANPYIDIKEGIDSEDEFCKEIYKIPAINEILNKEYYLKQPF